MRRDRHLKNPREKEKLLWMAVQRTQRVRWAFASPRLTVLEDISNLHLSDSFQIAFKLSLISTSSRFWTVGLALWAMPARRRAPALQNWYNYMPQDWRRRFPTPVKNRLSSKANGNQQGHGRKMAGRKMDGVGCSQDRK
jgi:hypothetical protein